MLMQTFQNFLSDDSAWDMYITGAAGTGKTTGLATLVDYCKAKDIAYTVCAYTHKACGVLRSKLPADAKVQTLHKYLKKRPGVNTEATKAANVEINMKMGDSEKIQLLFIDEYSMIGDKDFTDISAMQGEDDTGAPLLKVIWIGDKHQLPPVKDVQAVRPYGKYQVLLTTIHRQSNDNPLLDTLAMLVRFIEGEKVQQLKPNAAFIRGQNIVSAYLNNPSEDKVILAYTNKKVQELNWDIAGKTGPDYEDPVFSPTNKQSYKFLDDLERVAFIQSPYEPTKMLDMYDKWNTLSLLRSMPDVRYANVEDEDGTEYTYAYVFGHYEYKLIAEELKAAAAASNAIISKEFGAKPAQWAKDNYGHPLERQRAKAWREFLAFNEWVICLDFPHAQTVHKSQGSTYETVFVDTQDLGLAAEMDYSMYLRLMYVALSRASKCVITN